PLLSAHLGSPAPRWLAESWRVARLRVLLSPLSPPALRRPSPIPEPPRPPLLPSEDLRRPSEPPRRPSALPSRCLRQGGSQGSPWPSYPPRPHSTDLPPAPTHTTRA